MPDPAEGGNGGGAQESSNAVFEAPPGQEQQGGEQQSQGGEETPQGEGQQQQQAAPTQGSLTAAEIATALKQAGIGVQQPPTQQQQQPRQYTQEEFDRVFNVFRPTERHMKLFVPNWDTLTPEQKQESGAVFGEIVNALMKQATTMSHYQLQQFQEDQFAPVQQFIRQAHEANLKQEFYTQHEDLKPYESLVDAIVAKMKTNGFNGSKDDAFKIVSEEARKIIKGLPGQNGTNGQQQQGANGQQQKPKTTQSSRMSTVSAGGQGGVGDGGTRGGGKKSPSHAVFD